MKLFYVGAGPSPRLLVRSGDRPNHPVQAMTVMASRATLYNVVYVYTY